MRCAHATDRIFRKPKAAPEDGTVRDLTGAVLISLTKGAVGVGERMCALWYDRDRQLRESSKVYLQHTTPVPTTIELGP